MSQPVRIESKSLWNNTLSPGWSIEEVFILKLALQKFGVGRWKRIIESECLPGKSIGQIYLQTQRIMGQQSLGGNFDIILISKNSWGFILTSKQYFLTT